MKEKLVKIELTLGISLALIVVLVMIGNPHVTGYLSLDFVMQDLDMTIDQSQKFMISTDSEEEFSLTSLKISGEVIGEGRAEIYLDNEEGQKLMIYRNVKTKSIGMGAITGYFVNGQQDNHIKITQEGTIDEEMTELTEKEETTNGLFSNECKETCFIKMRMKKGLNYNLLVKVDKGTKVRINEIAYTIQTDEE